MHLAAWGSCLTLLLATAYAVCGDAADPWSFQLPASSRVLPAQFSVDIEGTSVDGLYSISVKANTGKLTQNGETIDVVVANQIPYSGDLVLFDLYGSNSQIILTSWAYCRSGVLTDLYLESTRGNSNFTPSDISGTCVVSQQPANPVLTTQSECITINPAPQVPSLYGDTLSLRSGSEGNITLGDEDFRILPYAIVDCADCPADSRGGWVEVHTVLAAQATTDVCLGIFYLFVSCRPTATLQYVQCFRGNETSQDINAGYDLRPSIGNVSPGQCCSGSQCQGLSAAFVPFSNSSSSSSSSSSSTSSTSVSVLTTSGVPPAITSSIPPSTTVTTSNNGGAATPTPSETRTGGASSSKRMSLHSEILYIISLIAVLSVS